MTHLFKRLTTLPEMRSRGVGNDGPSPSSPPLQRFGERRIDVWEGAAACK